MCYVRCHGMAAQKAAVHGGSCDSGTGKLALHSAAACMASGSIICRKEKELPIDSLANMHATGHTHVLAAVRRTGTLAECDRLQRLRPGRRSAGKASHQACCLVGWHSERCSLCVAWQAMDAGLARGSKANLGLVGGGSSGSCMPWGCAGKLQLWALQDRCVCICPEPLLVAIFSHAG